MRDISILIPSYNYVCTSLVSELRRQASQLAIGYEIIVADDGSSDTACTEANSKIGTWPQCRFIRMEKNIGRAAIRNMLAREASLEWLLFLDCDMETGSSNFLHTYATYDTDKDVLDGGIGIGGRQDMLHGNIRFLYEKKASARHSAEMRSLAPYKSFRTTNFMVRRSVMLANPFDERFLHYGYEDVLFGKHLQQNGIQICHIDNPTVLTDYESNEVFIAKTEEAMRTLYTFRDDLQGYSRLLDRALRLPQWPFVVWHCLFGRWERKNLTGSWPLLALFDIYKIGYFVTLFRKQPLRQ